MTPHCGKHSSTHLLIHSVIHSFTDTASRHSISRAFPLASPSYLMAFYFRFKYITLMGHTAYKYVYKYKYTRIHTHSKNTFHILSIWLSVCLCVCVYVCAFVPSPGFPFGNKGHIFMAYGMKRVNWHIQIQHSSTYTIYWLCIFVILECNLENDYHNSFTNVSSP